MPWTDKHILWLVPTPPGLLTSDGKPIEVWEFQHQDDPAVMAAWAKHFRNHYCLDTQIDLLRNGTGLSRADYLKTVKFPDPIASPGPSIRSGDFAEILVADYLRYVLNYWVPRSRYSNKAVRNESTKGSDVLGFKIVRQGVPSQRDELALFETKAQLTGRTPAPRLQDAINDSVKDEIRKAESLNAIKQKLLDSGAIGDIATVERFQNFTDHPYTEKYGAVAVFSTSAYSTTTVGESSTAGHPHSARLALMVIRGDDLMTLTHQLYQRAANEA
jgi:hypothetical protein